MLYNALRNFLVDVISEFLQFIPSFSDSLFRASLRTETITNNIDLTASPLTEELIKSVYDRIYLFVLILVALKCVWKGFQVYVLWRDGDADVSPHHLVVGTVLALAASVAFPAVYNIAVDAAVDLGTQIIAIINTATGHSPFGGSVVPDNLDIGVGSSLLMLIAILVFLICYLVLFFRLMARGIEMLFLRWGFPIAALGLVNSDGGIFPSYIQLLLKQMATSLIQIVALILSLYIALGEGMMSIALSIAVLFVSFKVPALLSQIMTPQRSGGGMGQTLHTGLMIKSLFTRGNG